MKRRCCADLLSCGDEMLGVPDDVPGLVATADATADANEVAGTIPDIGTVLVV